MAADKKGGGAKEGSPPSKTTPSTSTPTAPSGVKDAAAASQTRPAGPSGAKGATKGSKAKTAVSGDAVKPSASAELQTTATLDAANTASQKAQECAREMTPPPKLATVVAAASAAAPRPSEQPTARPPLKATVASTSKGAPGARPGTAPLTFAQALGGAVGAPARGASTLEVVGKFIAPRPNPPEAQLKSRERGLQEMFHKRWHSEEHGVCFEAVRGVSSEGYLEAISKLVPLHQVFAIGPMGQGTILVTLNTEEAAHKLLSAGIELAGRHLAAYPEARRPQRVVLSPVPVRVDDQCLVDFLSKFGKVQGRIRALPLRLGEKGLARGIFSLSREAFVTLNPGCELPPGFRLVLEGSVTYVELTTETRCYRCRQIGHVAARCPKGAPKENASKATLAPKETSAPKTSREPATEVPTSSEEDGESEEPASSSNKGKRRRRRKRKTAQPVEKDGQTSEGATLMPPPASVPQTESTPPRSASVEPHRPRAGTLTSDAEKRRRSDGEEQAPAPKARVVSARETGSDLSEVEAIPPPRTRAASIVDYDTEASAVSVASVEALPEGPLNRIQLRALVRDVSSKKNMETVKTIVSAYTQRYYELISQLEALSKEAREGRQYNQEAKLGRIIAKIEQIALEADGQRSEERQAPAPPRDA